MNYRHIYHAGNFADVLKHAVLARLVRYLQNKDKAFRVLDTQCQPTPTSVNLTQFQAESGFLVTVTCSYSTYFEGERIRLPGPGGEPEQVADPLAKGIYRISAVACNGASSSCPDQTGAAAAADYVERARVATACVVMDPSNNLIPCEN